MDKIQWHPAFCSATELELRKNKDDLLFETEHNLSKKPLQMDMLVVKKKNNADIKSEIGKIFRKHNIFEYKGEGDLLNIDVFYKVLGYACLYKSFGKYVNEIPAEDITVTLIRHAYPRELFKALTSMGIEYAEQYPGIYYIKYLAKGTIQFPVQIIVTKNLDRRKHAALKIVTNDADEQDIRQFLTDTKGITEQGDLNNIDAIMQVSVSANSEIYEKIRRDSIMCQALRELMKDEFDKEIEENRIDAKREGILEGKREGILEGQRNTNLDSIKNIMESLKYTASQAMDVLKIPTSERAFYQSKL